MSTSERVEKIEYFDWQFYVQSIKTSEYMSGFLYKIGREFNTFEELDIFLYNSFFQFCAL